MKIPLQKIRPSPNPIRKSWDDDKLRDLSWSLLEEGQVEPIGVYEDPEGYTVVWGHRRVEAARRAGWTEIDALVVAQDAIDNLVQSGIENLSSEEMTADDKAAWAQRLVDMGFTQHEIARRTSIPAVTINQWLQYRREKEAGVYVHVQNPLKDEGIIKTIKIAQALGDDLEAKKAVAAKVSSEGLTQLQTTEIARAYHDAPNPEVKLKILETPLLSSDTSADILRRSLAKLEFDKIRIPKNRSGEGTREKLYTDEDFAKALKQFVDALQSFHNMGNRMVRLTRYGTFSKAAVRYGIRRIDELMDELKTYKEFLEGAK
jgi:ParB family chromosome partitioning protein